MLRKSIFALVAASSISLLIISLPGCGGGGAAAGTAAAGGTGGGTGAGGGSTAPINLVNGQAATVVIGQPNFTTSAALTTATATTLHSPNGNVSVDSATGKLYIGDSTNNRVLVFNGIPAGNGASASFAIGQNDLISKICGDTASLLGVSATGICLPAFPEAAGGQLFFADVQNNRVAIYNPAPTAQPGTITTVVGQANKTSVAFPAVCNASSLNFPQSVMAAGGKLVVADSGNSRVLIWNTVPTVDGTAANLVLGQTNMTTCTPPATPTSSSVGGILWTDGIRLVMADFTYNRVLIWNTFPTVNNQPADLVLGQPNFTSGASGVSATSLWRPQAVYVNAAGQLFVADSANNRVLVWNTFPTVINQAADRVLGQPSFASSASGVSATTLNTPSGVTTSGNQVLVTDFSNNRVLVY